tara:strand:- start:86 stop:961 length:876 start_codon:yes stop_codon:yes gene_type:complete
LISICIPTYNTDCTELLEALSRELNTINKEIEVLVVDDGSTVYQKRNEKKCTDFGFRYIAMNGNFGRVSTRIRLSKESQHPYLLFIDADMIPAYLNYIKTYLNNINDQTKAIFGGYSYDFESFEKNLRYNYGKQREQKAANLRNKNPYKLIFSGNMLISKNLFEQTSKISDNVYGLDLLLGASLKKHNIPILHINNETYHHGIDDNKLFLSKIKSGATTLREYYEANIIKADQNNLIHAYESLKKYRLNFIFCNSFLPIGKCLYHILNRYGKPLFFLDWYRLYYFTNPNKS